MKICKLPIRKKTVSGWLGLITSSAHMSGSSACIQARPSYILGLIRARSYWYKVLNKIRLNATASNTIKSDVCSLQSILRLQDFICCRDKESPLYIDIQQYTHLKSWHFCVENNMFMHSNKIMICAPLKHKTLYCMH